MAKKRLFLLDANALLHRAWHALPPLTNSEGKVVNAVYGTMMVCLKLVEEYKPDAFIACWDTEAPTFRHEEFKAYKAQREEQPDELYDQLPEIKEGLLTLGIASIEKDGFEADDLIGTLAAKASKDGWQVVIVTSDRDSLQLVNDDVSVLAFKKGVTDTILFDSKEVEAQYGLKPSQFIDYKALRGDPSDNIPGVKGIGEKTATDLLQSFGSIKGILKAAHDAKSDMGKSVREKLLAAESEIPSIVRLVTIILDAPIDWKPQPLDRLADPKELEAFLQKMGFKTLLKRIQLKNGSSATDSASPAKAGAQKKKKQKPVSDPDSEEESATNPTLEPIKLTGCETITASKEVPAALASLATKNEWTIFISQGAEGTLFAGQVDGLILLADTGCYLFKQEVLSQAAIKKQLNTHLQDSAIKKYTHDGKTQSKALEQLGLAVDKWSFDTMLAAYLLSAGERNHDLAALAYRLLNQSLPLDASPVLQAQAISKCILPLQIQLNEQNLDTILRRFELPLIPVLFDMEKVGIKIDKPYLSSLAKDFNEAKSAVEQKAYKLVGHEFNLGSPVQLAEILFNELALPTKGIKKGKTGFSTAASELEKLRGQHALIELIEEYREMAKLLSTYVETLPLQADRSSRVHTSFNQAIAATGRLSSTDPNLQNIPIRTELGRKIRTAFIAEEGYQLLSCDYSQIELRIIAALAKDQRMLDAFQHGADIHAATAANIWEIPLKEVTPEQRRIAKAINFGLIFGQGPQGLSQVAGITFAEAKLFIANYFKAYTGIRRYMDETKALAHQLGYVETLFGRRRYMPEINSMLHQLRAQAERMAINMPVQGTDADLMKLAMIEIHKQLPTLFPDARLVLQVHDELLFEVPTKQVESLAKTIKDIMENIEKIGVPIVVEAKAGNNWGDMKKLSL